jgi:hypothetical protein
MLLKVMCFVFLRGLIIKFETDDSGLGFFLWKEEGRVC